MSRNRGTTVRWLLGLMCLLFSAVATAQLDRTNDVRVLIDVSGSMKQNDPHKLRAPALRLLVGLLPEGSEAGVWTFGQYVNMQVKHGRVDSHWKDRARAESKKIHSRGLFTNIEEALKRATFGWLKPDVKTRRNLILLTDGRVDISRDAKKNAASRKRILEKLLPRLKKAGARLHSIALSDGVDKDLLKRISAATGGSYIQVENAASLERAFLKLFEKTAPADSLPIKGNRFKVDTSVQDMTVLVFRKENTPVKLISPQGKSFDDSHHPKNFAWHKEQSYELVTVKKPGAGEWQVKGSKDSDNRVMIVTNLKLNTSELAPSILSGDKLWLKAELLDKGKPITRKSFLNLVSFETELNDDKRYMMQDTGEGADSKKNDGSYSVDLTGKLSEGEQLITIRAKGPTFEREIRYSVDNFLGIVDIKLTEDEKSEYFYLSIIPHIEILDPESIRMELKLKDGSHLNIRQEPGGLWLSEIDKKHEGKLVSINIKAKRYTGEAVEAEIKKKLVVKTNKNAHHQEAVSQAEKEEENKGEEHPVDNKSEHEQSKEDEDHGETNWFMIGWVTMVINLIAGIIGVLGFQFWKKKKAIQDEQDDKDVAL